MVFGIVLGVFGTLGTILITVLGIDAEQGTPYSRKMPFYYVISSSLSTEGALVSLLNFDFLGPFRGWGVWIYSSWLIFSLLVFLLALFQALKKIFYSLGKPKGQPLLPDLRKDHLEFF